MLIRCLYLIKNETKGLFKPYKLYFLREIIANMKVGKRAVRQKVWSADQIQFDDDGRGFTRDEGITGELANDWKK